MACMRESFQSGVVLDGRYQTIGPLNHGSFGMVFMARDLETDNTVAIKCLTKKTTADEAGLDFAIDDKSEELVLHRRLSQHPNIVNLIDSFETESHVYIVLEFCPRGDLYEAIRNGHGPLETEHVRRFMLELVDAVAYIHSKGIYHRDIKPENIFLSQTGSLKLGDFGLATTEKWTYETTVGSDRYMSPEQYDSAGAGYSPAQADIWAIGICLLNILFSRNPFTTPTEADPLFLDFSRDKQSLFDVFPSMSQDTYEVIVQCMNLDPSKRSIVGARDALRRLVSFTTLDEALDDFCSTDRRVVASANREPLRTPSIQSPQVDCGTFPWAKALQTTQAHATSQLSVIPDENESYSEDLFSKSEATTADWSSAMTGETPSMGSILDASLAASMKSLAVNQAPPMPRPKEEWSAFKVSPMAGSLPINMSRARNTPAMSLVFGKKNTAVSKSWSDMWDEDVEEEQERMRQLEALKKNNSRTWSQDGTHNVNNGPVVESSAQTAARSSSAFMEDDNTPRQGLSPATKTLALDMTDPIVKQQSVVDPVIVQDDLDDDIPFFSDPLSDENQESFGQAEQNQKHFDQLDVHHPYRQPKSPSTVDKWAALGERRRAYTGSHGATAWSGRSGGGFSGNGFGGYGYDFNSTVGIQISNMHADNNNNGIHSMISNSQSNGHNKWSIGKERSKECPWNKGRDRSWTFRRNKRSGFGDFEWVDGWQETHS